MLRRSLGVVLAGVLLAVSPVSAEPASIDAEEGFANAVAWQVFCDEYLGGRDSITALVIIKDLDDEFAARMRDAARGTTLADGFERQYQARKQIIDERLDAARAQLRADTETALWVIQQVLLDGADDVDLTAPKPVITTVADDTAAVYDPRESALNLLVSDTARRAPESRGVLTDTMKRLYDFDAGLPRVGSGNDVAASAGVVTRPVRFTNAGFEPATVKVATYVPGAEAAGATAPSASTVVFPSGGSSGALQLPVGTYTFCYEWQLDGDADADGKVDYAHRSTGQVNLTAASSNDPAAATTVTITPESNTPNGRCGESVVNEPAPPAAAGSGTTPQELANEGLHTYALSCIWDDGTPGDENTQVTISVDYGDGGLTLGGPSVPELFESATYFISRTGPNTFAGTGEGYFASVTMTDAGAALFIDYGEFWGTIDCTMTRTS